ncbi:tumor necrosis factor receptor superfamily member 5-like isoform X2 [Alosa sapidissima]|uniref:tumor necrosis factor receptor superfamily member 5-like isoform X2 n=1 Tax=Alosa sapidissima TaxID=34773 RepID=UPI001C09CA1B|nr:tumor necrosis factor receptor superfamily member 5-like isoform X2 [Alosa sapidissima]
MKGLQFIFILLMTVNLCDLVFSACGQAEYFIGEECCPMCGPAAGLRVKRACSSTSDTLCEPLEGHYCTDPIKDGCRGAVEHTKCSPGQYIKQPGNASSDAVCSDCVGATYSNGSFTSCRPHTRCESLGHVLKKPGTHTADAECEIRRHHMVLLANLIFACILFVVLTIVMAEKTRN